MATAAKKRKPQAPVLKPISEQMREWSAMLKAEVESWPKVEVKKMFGMTSLYRGKQIFAALPYSRTLGTATDSFIFKFEHPPSRILAKLQNDQRIIAEQGIGTRWFIFQIG